MHSVCQLQRNVVTSQVCAKYTQEVQISLRHCTSVGHYTGFSKNYLQLNKRTI